MVLIQSILAFIVTLGILVAIHEFGHYLIARWSGVRIVRFSIGFGRPLWSRVDRRGTEFAVAAIPFGGYLKMYDEADPSAPKTPGVGVSFSSLSPLWRIAIALGGPVANFILTVVVYWFLFVAGTTEMLPVLGPVPEDTPAWNAGLRGGEEVVSVDGTHTQGWQDIAQKLVDRLGETGTIVLGTRAPGAESTAAVELAITEWHSGVDEPAIFESLGIKIVRPAVVGSLVPDGPAERAGLKSNDLVIAADGSAVTRWQELVAAIEAAPNKPIDLTIKRQGVEKVIELVPGVRERQNPQTEEGAVTQVGFAGVVSATRTVRHPIGTALPMAVSTMVEKTVSIISTLKKMITGQVSTRNLSGPITIAQVAGDTVDQGWRRFVGLLALLSLSLGVLNLLPIPLLDGGQIVFHTAELMRGKPLSERTQMIGFQVGLFLVGGLMLLALSNDITRLLD